MGKRLPNGEGVKHELGAGVQCFGGKISTEKASVQGQ